MLLCVTSHAVGVSLHVASSIIGFSWYLIIRIFVVKLTSEMLTVRRRQPIVDTENNYHSGLYIYIYICIYVHVCAYGYPFYVCNFKSQFISKFVIVERHFLNFLALMYVYIRKPRFSIIFSFKKICFYQVWLLLDMFLYLTTVSAIVFFLIACLYQAFCASYVWVFLMITAHAYACHNISLAHARYWDLCLNALTIK